MVGLLVTACVVIAGQSNAVGQGVKSSLPARYTAGWPHIEYAYRLACEEDDGAAACGYVGTWGDVRYPTSGFGIEASMGQLMRPNTRLLKHATNSTDLAEDWAPYAETGYVLFNRLITAITVESADVTDIVWIQGEADANNSAKANAYNANLRAFIAALRRSISENLQFWIVYLHADCGRGGASIVRAAQVDVAAAHRFNHAIIPDAITDYDGLHYGNDGLIHLGKLVIAAIERTQDGYFV